MKKVIVSNWISLDGFFSGPAGETDWFTFDPELERYNLEKLKACDAIVFGGTTYRMMKAFWPTPLAKQEDPEVVRFMNETPKYTFSKTITSADWDHCFFFPEISHEAIDEIKGKSMKDIVILGSGDICMQLQRLGLIDQYNLMLDPQFLGRGKLFFRDLNPSSLQLLNAKAFSCGVNYLEYGMPGK